MGANFSYDFWSEADKYEVIYLHLHVHPQFTLRTLWTRSASNSKNLVTFTKYTYLVHPKIYIVQTQKYNLCVTYVLINSCTHKISRTQFILELVYIHTILSHSLSFINLLVSVLPSFTTPVASCLKQPS